MTAALERLLEIEVEATEARRPAAQERFACLPEPWTPADFDFSAQPGADEKLIRDLATVVGLDSPSYRLRHHQFHAETLRRGVITRVS